MEAALVDPGFQEVAPMQQFFAGLLELEGEGLLESFELEAYGIMAGAAGLWGFPEQQQLENEIEVEGHPQESELLGFLNGGRVTLRVRMRHSGKSCALTSSKNWLSNSRSKLAARAGSVGWEGALITSARASSTIIFYWKLENIILYCSLRIEEMVGWTAGNNRCRPIYKDSKCYQRKVKDPPEGLWCAVPFFSLPMPLLNLLLWDFD
jgi:hypothetical protein